MRKHSKAPNPWLKRCGSFYLKTTQKFHNGFYCENMEKPSIHHAVTELIEPVFREDNIELVDVEFKKAEKTWILRVFIDKSQGVTVDDCQKFSREIEDLIEVHELIAVPYVLEVSSPGLDRPLKKKSDFLRNKGKRIQIKTFSPVNNKRQFSGTIGNFMNETLFLEDNDDVLEVHLDKIAHAKLIIEF